jgi:hypothetical protein
MGFSLLTHGPIYCQVLRAAPILSLRPVRAVGDELILTLS